MAGRKGSGVEKVIPHTRIEEETSIWKTYEPGDLVGQGTFGKVFKVKHTDSGVFWAMKVVNKEKAGTSAVKLLEREVTILKRVEHENIISLNEVFETSKKMYLMMEYCEGGELADALKKQGTYPEAEVKVIVQRLAQAITYLHKNDIVHRDLKLENILLSQNPSNPDDHLHIKVTDFGLSVVKSGVGHDSMIQDFCGTPMYMSPEIIDNKTYSQQCDVWAMGVIVYTLLCGVPPFKSKDEESLYELIKSGQFDETNERFVEISEAGQNCIRKMLKVDPAHRLTAYEVLSNPWLTGVTADSSQPSNVLEMMKMWRDEMTVKDNTDSAINGENESQDLMDGEAENRPLETSESPDKVTANGKTSNEHSNKSDVKKPGSGGRSGARSNNNTTPRSTLGVPSNRSSGAKSPGTMNSKNVSQINNKPSTANRTNQSNKNRSVKK